MCLTCYKSFPRVEYIAEHEQSKHNYSCGIYPMVPEASKDYSLRNFVESSLDFSLWSHAETVVSHRRTVT